MKNPIILLFFLLLASVSLAQNRQIAGTVMGEDGLPVLGATVQVKGTSIGASTDLDGKYSIQASSTDILIFTYLGLQTLEELVGQRNVVDVVLKDSTNELDQIIVTGYSKQKKSRSTSATLIVDEEVVQNQARPTLQESLQGNAAGVEVNNLSGQPGATPNVRIRGVGTFEGAAPLYVIDGFQTRDAGIIAQLNPNDVKSLQILKDAAGLAIYGTRGANGVIVITTKQGRAGKTKVNYSSLAGFTDLSVQDDFKPLGTPEFQELLVEGVINNPGLPNNPNDALTYLTDRGFNPDVNTDWYDLITQTGFFQQHNVSVSGGSEKSRYFISGSYQNTEGTIQSSDAELMNIRVNLD